jgi:hypothetical protein
MSTSPGSPGNAMILREAVNKEIAQTSRVVMNVSQETLVISVDKVRLCLLEHISLLEKRKDWIAPVSIVTSIIATLATSTFRDAWLDAATWRAVFGIALVLSIGWSAKTIYAALKAPTLDDVISKLKQASSASVVASSGDQSGITTSVELVTSELQCAQCGTLIQDGICPRCSTA